MPKDDKLIEEALTSGLSRRDLFKRLIAAGISLSAASAMLSEVGLDGVAEAADYKDSLTAQPRKGGVARVATVVPATDVDPVTMFNEGAIFTTQMSCEYLCFPRADYTLKPKLATSWHAPRPNTWVFNLRPGVRFHDGSHFSADDVVATFDRIADPKVASSALSAFKGILSKGHIRKTGPLQVTFHLDRPYVDFPYIVSAFNYNALILPKHYKIGSFTKGHVGTGPFILTKYTPKVGASFRANPHYWNKGQPHVSGVELKYFADNSATVLAMEAGALDIFLDMPYQGSQALFSNSRLRILENPSSAYREVHMRVDKKPFNDIRVRQAVALCLDRQAIITGLLHGLGQLGNDHAFAPIYPQSISTKRIPQRRQDYAAARKLLAQAGHPNGFDIQLTTEDFLEIPQYANYIQQQLKPAGINVTLNIENQNSYYGTGANQPWLDVPFGIVDWAPRGAASQTITPAYLCGGIWNSAHWCNSQYDSFLSLNDRSLRPARRNQLAFEAATVQHDEVPAVIAYWLKELRATDKKVHGLAAGPAASVDPSAIFFS